ncbi:hypothetical protein DEU56DRAFT_758034 [Suillus clintonianus]|uniref:uncharacterized protein n=1 Tax=Suillus clintonianus TaxID=1904413 RepID=UPI001B861CC2|nr:uncharacterized protein DEU56DRAFT_758034 [Suillus clintonianus]KAG2129749.1 hypothetical protein DEU56DRAFT_758034 [Suillus clintonianus]
MSQMYVRRQRLSENQYIQWMDGPDKSRWKRGKAHYAQARESARSLCKARESRTYSADRDEVNTLESAAKHNELKRADTAQTLKASGALYDAYTTKELICCSWWSLTEPSGARQVFIGLQDRTMILLGATMALRGESLCMLQLSDLFVSSAFLDSILDGCVPAVLTALTDNTKTNQHGQVDEHGTLCHCLVEFCPVGSLAMLLYALQCQTLNDPGSQLRERQRIRKTAFKVTPGDSKGKDQHDLPVPDFSPQFDVPGFGEFGYRPWYELFVFWGDNPKRQMSYDKPPAKLLSQIFPWAETEFHGFCLTHTGDGSGGVKLQDGCNAGAGGSYGRHAWCYCDDKRIMAHQKSSSICCSTSARKNYHHTWEWESGRLIPFYVFQTVSKITDIWDKHSNGLNGYLAIWDLNEYWGARWRHNLDGQRTVNSCRKKVKNLVKNLAKKANWNIKLALCFLRNKYKMRGMTPRAFCTYLQKSGGSNIEKVMHQGIGENLVFVDINGKFRPNIYPIISEDKRIYTQNIMPFKDKKVQYRSNFDELIYVS